ncbi:hypothetical protein SBV1_3030020 [Verrucomicrobia bacterium]|nr:hypothetical protein SBV1_3030020 [Verrucomicrobiota bacterium]
MPPLSSGNPFRRFPSGSSQQITNITNLRNEGRVARAVHGRPRRAGGRVTRKTGPSYEHPSRQLVGHL